MMRPLILIIDDEARVREMYAAILTDAGYQVILAEDGEGGLHSALNNNVNLVLLDLVLPDINGIDVLTQILQNKPSLPVIMISGYASIDNAVQATKIGAYDFLEKPIEREKMLIKVRNALALDEKEKEIARLRKEALQRYQMVGFSFAMRQIFTMIDNVAQSNATVLITGESGVGKELIARAIHNQSKRANGPFVKINCAAMPETLIESELFGYEKGAFTGAYTQKKGKLEIANLGTLFMDEVCDLSLSAQAKLLR
ncbi:MAG: sigma-54 dependent transcriptional regulator, partial [candidate division WOR-3 bacterium]|nr:sigma-54 dependent transcriptional regulator [candidate division WOR-3 bacterium]